MRALNLLLLLGVLLPYLPGQSLDQYVQIALENNLELAQKDLSFQEAQAQLAQAKALFWPQLGINGRFSVAQGGRTIDIPAGDLVNPAYQNLNALNQYISGSDPTYPAFPNYGTVDNASINFLRATEQETVVRLSMPVYNNSIVRNRQIKESMLAASGSELAGFRRQLQRDVKQAYYIYSQAHYGRQIFEDALQLVEDNLRTTQSLQAHHQVTAADVYSSQAQVASVQQQLAVAIQQEQSAQAYFNTLLRREYTEPIKLEEQPEHSTEAILGLEAAQQQAWQQREELEQLNFYLAAADENSKLASGNRLPTVNFQADYGIQGATYSFTSEDDFFLGSLVLQVPLFNKATSAKVQEAQLAQQRLLQQKAAAEQQIGLQVINQYYALQAAQTQVVQAQQQKLAATEAFRLQKRLYEQGQSNLVTFTNARTSLTTAEQQLIINRYNYLQQVAEWEWAVGN
ncbi:TolC family protein [Lewinella cohaerens]|uniref:TolC family protein n=1 Tax=Lewinella cohaerens TaxID=70995 RepID=UPI0003653B8A|nr:TolC family protein [Lewinella cohaerens]